MTIRMRRESRQQIDRPAWISVGDDFPLRNCRLIDLSEGGARLVLEDADGLPKNFSLWLSRYGQPRYWCEVIWSCDNAIGVQFLR